MLSVLKVNPSHGTKWQRLTESVNQILTTILSQRFNIHFVAISIFLSILPLHYSIAKYVHRKFKPCVFYHWSWRRKDDGGIWLMSNNSSSLFPSVTYTSSNFCCVLLSYTVCCVRRCIYLIIGSFHDVDAHLFKIR